MSILYLEPKIEGLGGKNSALPPVRVYMDFDYNQHIA